MKRIGFILFVVGMRLIVGSSFAPLLHDQNPYLALIGGAGSGKSEFLGGKVFYRCHEEGDHNFFIFRKVGNTLKKSVIPVMTTILDQNGVQYSYNKTDHVIEFRNKNFKRNRLNFTGLDDSDKIKSLKGATSFALDEATDFTIYDFMQLDLRLREPTGHYLQMMMALNPDEAAAPWIKEIFHDKKPEYKDYWRNATVHHSTWRDNPINLVRLKYKQKLDRIVDPVYRKIYVEGQWALAKGIIYNWDVQELPTDNLAWYDDIFYGLDFGYSVDPAAVVRIYRKADEYWIEELIYETGLTNADLARLIKAKGVQRHQPIYCDSAEPKSIQELSNAGLNAKPAEKGPDSVRAGIDYLKSLKIHVVDGSENLIREKGRYKYSEDKSGQSLAVPVDAFNHGMDATRYGIYTHRRGICASAPVIHGKRFDHFDF